MKSIAPTTLISFSMLTGSMGLGYWLHAFVSDEKLSTLQLTEFGLLVLAVLLLHEITRAAIDVSIVGIRLSEEWKAIAYPRRLRAAAVAMTLFPAFACVAAVGVSVVSFIKLVFQPKAGSDQGKIVVAFEAWARGSLDYWWLMTNRLGAWWLQLGAGSRHARRILEAAAQSADQSGCRTLGDRYREMITLLRARRPAGTPSPFVNDVVQTEAQTQAVVPPPVRRAETQSRPAVPMLSPQRRRRKGTIDPNQDAFDFNAEVG
jgi:hypothetical protein